MLKKNISALKKIKTLKQRKSHQLYETLRYNKIYLTDLNYIRLFETLSGIILI